MMTCNSQHIAVAVFVRRMQSVNDADPIRRCVGIGHPSCASPAIYASLGGYASSAERSSDIRTFPAQYGIQPTY